MVQQYSVNGVVDPRFKAWLLRDKASIAAELQVTERAVESWACGERRPRIPTAIKLQRMARMAGVRLPLESVLSANVR